MIVLGLLFTISEDIWYVDVVIFCLDNWILVFTILSKFCNAMIFWWCGRIGSQNAQPNWNKMRDPVWFYTNSVTFLSSTGILYMKTGRMNLELDFGKIISQNTFNRNKLCRALYFHVLVYYWQIIVTFSFYKFY